MLIEVLTINASCITKIAKLYIIDILTLQPILKLPPLWDVNYLGLSYPIILQIV